MPHVPNKWLEAERGVSAGSLVLEHLSVDMGGAREGGTQTRQNSPTRRMNFNPHNGVLWFPVPFFPSVGVFFSNYLYSKCGYSFKPQTACTLLASVSSHHCCSVEQMTHRHRDALGFCRLLVCLCCALRYLASSPSLPPPQILPEQPLTRTQASGLS